MKKIYYYIYETTNIVNSKTYIGQHTTENLDDGYLGSGYTFRRALKKYGKNNFRKEILMFAVNQSALNFIEKCLVTKEFIDNISNYNLREGGARGRHSEETKLKMRKPRTLQGRENIRKAKQNITIDTRQKMSKSAKARPEISDYTRKKLSDLGKLRKHTPEELRKISDGNKGKIISIEQRKSISARSAKKFPPIINTESGEIILNGTNCRVFCKIYDIPTTSFNRMINGLSNSARHWILYHP